jgi:hypothetical protein
VTWQKICGDAGQVMVGGVKSLVHVAVREVVDVLPHTSVAVKVLVCEREQALDVTGLSVEVTVGVPQASFADAVPSAPLRVAVDGLQPSVNDVPDAVIVGGVLSSVQVTVLDMVDVLPHPSFAMNVLVNERPHPLLTTDPSDELIVTDPHPSVAVAEPSEPEGLDGLQPKEMFE